MGIVQILTETPGQINQPNVRRVKIITTDNLSTVTTAGYLNPQSLQGFTIYNTDEICMWYGATASVNNITSPGTFGIFTASISGATGVITLVAWVNPGTVTAPVVPGNIPKFSGTTGLEVDSGIAATSLALSTISSPDAQSDLIWYDVTCTAAALATAGKVNVQVSSGAKQYKVRNVIFNYSAAGLSGGGGDRLLALTDGTTVYNDTGITAALLGTPVNTVWGGSGNPVAGTVAQNTSTAAGANLYFQYAGGTTDYTTGSVVISVLVQRVA